MTYSLPTTESNARQFAQFEIEDDPTLSMTGLAELIARRFDADDWLDDETHWVWDIAAELAPVA
jgi:hypothetical protein